VTRKLWLGLGAGALFVIGIVGGAAWFQFAGPDASPADPDHSAQVILGHTIYVSRCAACHGLHLEGQPNWRQRLPNGRLPAPPHDADGHTWHHPDRQLFKMVKNGLASFVPGYQTDMPIFRNVLSDEEIWAVLAYIKSRWPPHVREVQSRIGREAGDGAAPP